jgi:hypothetical protein
MNHCGLGQARHARDFTQKQHPGLARIQADVVRRFDGHGHDALADSIEVDRHLHFVFLFALFFLSFFSFFCALVGFFGFVGVLALFVAGRFFLVALRFDG